MKLKIYLAARYSRREEMLAYSRALTDMGHEVTSRWITGCHEIPGKRDGNGANAYTDEERAVFAVDDERDLFAADTIIAFTETPRDPSTNRGGRHVEFGMAIAWGHRLIVVGPRENVFHCLPCVEQFDTFEALQSALMHEQINQSA